jgi:hypothetical protein
VYNNEHEHEVGGSEQYHQGVIVPVLCGP